MDKTTVIICDAQIMEAMTELLESIEKVLKLLKEACVAEEE